LTFLDPVRATLVTSDSASLSSLSPARNCVLHADNVSATHIHKDSYRDVPVFWLHDTW